MSTYSDSDELIGESAVGHTVQGDSGLSFESYARIIADRERADVSYRISQDEERRESVDRMAETVRVPISVGV